MIQKCTNLFTNLKLIKNIWDHIYSFDEGVLGPSAKAPRTEIMQNQKWKRKRKTWMKRQFIWRRRVAEKSVRWKRTTMENGLSQIRPTFIYVKREIVWWLRVTQRSFGALNHTLREVTWLLNEIIWTTCFSFSSALNRNLTSQLTGFARAGRAGRPVLPFWKGQNDWRETLVASFENGRTGRDLRPGAGREEEEPMWPGEQLGELPARLHFERTKGGCTNSELFRAIFRKHKQIWASPLPAFEISWWGTSPQTYITAP